MCPLFVGENMKMKKELFDLIHDFLALRNQAAQTEKRIIKGV